MNLRIISAGAGSGKTYRLTSEMVALLRDGVRASGIIATTFTKKAAAELQERVRVRLLEEGLSEQADQLTNALIGTVHGLGVKLLQRFAFEAGVSPEVDIIADEDQQVLFNLSLATVLTSERVEKMEYLSDRLGLNKRERYDWRREVKKVTDIARANDFSAEGLEKSKARSFESFRQFLGQPEEGQPEGYFEHRLDQLMGETIARLENNADETKKTREAANSLKAFQRTLNLRRYLYWHEWAKISKLDVGAKSRDDVAELLEFAAAHGRHPEFQDDIRAFIYNIFDIAIAAIREYDGYKKRRGLIDYTDMEVLVNRLLGQPTVSAVLKQELDLLMVDEFQDTSPIQLEIFLKLSKLAKHSVWVGDPKQSIYGFRGAAPELMQAIIQKVGGVKPEDIQEYSWRSREDIVHAVNALFTKAFTNLPPEQVALKAKLSKDTEPIEMEDALLHWHFRYDGEGRLPGRPWMENCIAASLREVLARPLYVVPKGAKEARQAVPGDTAILCRSNAECQVVAEALHRMGLRAAISRSGLLATAEAKLILACLKYILNQYDSLSVAEILLLASGQPVEDIIESRLEYLEKIDNGSGRGGQWAGDDAFILALDRLREQTIELSSAEILNLLLEGLDLRRIVASWGNEQQRLDNVDVLRKLALQYEEACNRLHSAASLGGFLLWLGDLENNDADLQGSGEGPDAVNVLTYHKSKGLEWPMVICHSLEGPLRAEVWGVDIIQESEEVDLDNVLGNRWLRYWVNPYADQIRSTALDEKLSESEATRIAREKALQEEARLLYVGLTRARDYLVFPSRASATKWLNRVWHQGEESHPTLDPDSSESPWEWGGHFLKINTEPFSYPRDFTHAEPPEKEIVYLAERAGPQQHELYDIDAAREPFTHEVSARIGDVLHYDNQLNLEEGIDLYSAAKGIKAFLTGDHSSYPAKERLKMAEGFIERYEMGSTPPEVLARLSDAWMSFLSRQFDIRQAYRKYPIRYFHHGRLFTNVIDLVLDTPRGLVVIQNSGFAGGDPTKEKQRALQNLGSWCYLSSLAVREIFNREEARAFVHFVMSGNLVEVVSVSGSR
ncbi:MAG: UvrD-helicase domain-containing protein [Phaeodactylibacter sp.]|nr:UvrD-helicase domain-containing protein [Phaeodactylibacter sp.]MCB9051430.1 UvrD-helicase domain-containing protein [Lewinellaceae bacterium]